MLYSELISQPNLLQSEITIKRTKYSTRVLLEEVLPSAGIYVSYNDNIIPLEKTIFFDSKSAHTLQSILEKIVKNENLTYQNLQGLVILKFYPRPAVSYRHTFNGRILDEETGEVLIGASVYIDEIQSGVSSNPYGYYSFTLPRGDYSCVIRYLGYETNHFEINLSDDLEKDIELKPRTIQLEDLVIEEMDPLEVKVHSLLSSTNRINMDMVEKIPYLGEVDVFQSSLLLPGITNIGEGVTGINVRGGHAYQNLVLLDEAILYNSNHFFGLISVFNPDAVNHVEILKGDFPSKYGGRNSSLMHIRQKEGNSKELKVSGGLGLITSRLMIEGPALDGEMTYLFSARSTFWDLVLRNLSNPLFNDIRANFQDINGKLSYNINAKNKVYLSGYWGGDATKFGTDALQKWGNSIFSFRWNHIMNEKHFFNTTFYHSGYRYSVTESQAFRDFEGRSKIDDYALKLDATSYINPNWIIEWGASTIYHRLVPADLILGSLDTSGNDVSFPEETGFENAIYVSAENRLSRKFTTALGLRLTHFRNNGVSDVYKFEEGSPYHAETIYDTLFSATGESAKNYWRLLPRISLKLQTGDHTSIKANMTNTVQFMHLISNTISPTESDRWILSGHNIKPTTMSQYTLGVYHHFPWLDMNSSVEVYLRNSENVIDLKNGSDIFFSDIIETQLVYGLERAYGIEFFAKKTIGRWTGWLGYTLSRVERKFENEFDELEFNDGDFFPSDFDRTHDFSVTLAYNVSSRVSLSSNFVYYTGRPFSFPDSKYEFDGILIPHYENKNLNRLSDYHRLDVSATIQLNQYKRNGEKRNYESELVFSVYNLYGRKNVQAYFFTEDENNPGQSSVQQLSALGFPVPSITYNFKF